MNLQREDLKGKKVLVFGSGISGMGAAKLLQEVGAEILLYDGNEKLKEEDIRKNCRKAAAVRSFWESCRIR